MDEITRRKSEHIDICINENVVGSDITTGLEKYMFQHNALPEMEFKEISIATEFLNKKLKTPFIISSMTGGTERALHINKTLAKAAEERGWALGLGSTRSALEKPESLYTFQVRKYAPTIPIFANLGAVQLNYGFGVDECKRIVDITEADGLVLHLNSIQEIIQTEGDTNFKNLFQKIKEIATHLDVPVGVKEVGWGIDGQTANQLFENGVSFVDVAGAGGTSWSQVEKFRSSDVIKTLAAEAFVNWGIPTADCIVDARRYNTRGTLIASGGLHSGVDAAKCLALGADLVGFGRTILKAADTSEEELLAIFSRLELELQISMFGIGVSSIEQLKQTNRLYKQK